MKYDNYYKECQIKYKEGMEKNTQEMNEMAKQIKSSE